MSLYCLFIQLSAIHHHQKVFFDMMIVYTVLKEKQLFFSQHKRKTSTVAFLYVDKFLY